MIIKGATDEGQQRERADLSSRFFALITMMLGAGASSANDCLGRRSSEGLRQGAEKLETLITEAGTIIAAATALIQDDE